LKSLSNKKQKAVEHPSIEPAAGQTIFAAADPNQLRFQKAVISAILFSMLEKQMCG
jgi:hypothetical protein